MQTLTDEEIIAKYKTTPYNFGPYRENEGTFRTHKLKNKRMEKRVGYHINAQTYELEEVNI